MPPADLEVFTREYDPSFSSIPNLTWRPWVGVDFPSCPPTHRLLIVGESHYAWVASPEQLEEHRKRHFANPDYTREVIAESAINEEWTNNTLRTIPKLLFRTGAIDRKRFWSATAYYNFIQTQLPYYNRGGSPERPSSSDFELGWQIFIQVVRAIRPSHCLFIGVTAANSFNASMHRQSEIHFKDVRITVKIGKVAARRAELEVDGQSVDLCFVQHCGKFFSWQRWHDYLLTEHPDMMNWLLKRPYLQG